MEWKPSSPVFGHKKAPPLKPSLVEWKHSISEIVRFSSAGLETFLGGMETCIAGSVASTEVGLETFLGGMETNLRWLPPAPTLPSLKPSLVEWKLERTISSVHGGETLETFLGGMETASRPRPLRPQAYLETFLGGMET